MKTNFLALTKPQSLRLEYVALPCPEKSHGNLVFFHGGGASIHNYRREIERLAEYFDVYAFSIPGFGRSTSMSSYSLDLLLQVMDQFVSELGIANPILMGHSFGGGLATQYALYSGKAKAAILIAPLLFPVPTGAVETAINIQRQKEVHRKYRSFGSLSKILRRGVLYSLKQLRSAIKLHRFLARVDFGANIEKIRVPVFAFLGAKDIVIPVSKQQHALAKVAHAQIKTYPEEGHLLFRTKLDEIIDIVLAGLEA